MNFNFFVKTSIWCLKFRLLSNQKPRYLYVSTNSTETPSRVSMERKVDADLGAKSIALVFLPLNSSFESRSACCSVIKSDFKLETAISREGAHEYTIVSSAEMGSLLKKSNILHITLKKK